MRRILAVVAAVAMVAGAMALRSRLDRDEEESSQLLRLVCSTELQAVCERLRDDEGARLEVSVEASGVTADRLARSGGDVNQTGLDGWLVSAPWPEIVDSRRRAAALVPLFDPPRPPLARSPLVMVVWKDRASVLGPRCPEGRVAWPCLAEGIAAPGGWPAIGGRGDWGPVKLGVADPVTTDTGLAAIGQAAGALLGRSDLSTVDLDDDAFQRSFGALARGARPSAASPLLQMLVTGPAAYDVVATTEAEAGPLVAGSARRGALDLLYPSPMATAEVVLATSGRLGGRLREVVSGTGGRQALAESGWRVAGAPFVPAGGIAGPALPATSGLPSPGFLDALRQRWREGTGR